ncbi:hypothetical protein GQR58_029940 [Nymphon striatum]|nr:hypothetical protein GQR58_029940 [Nymphon striatum]
MLRPDQNSSSRRYCHSEPAQRRRTKTEVFLDFGRHHPLLTPETTPPFTPASSPVTLSVRLSMLNASKPVKDSSSKVPASVRRGSHPFAIGPKPCTTISAWTSAAMNSASSPICGAANGSSSERTRGLGCPHPAGLYG